MEEFLKPIAEIAVDEIDAATTSKEFPSRRLGPSKLGHECAAYPWHLWRWSAQVTRKGPQKRVQDSGNDDEARVISTLRLAGWEIDDRNEHGNQYTFKSHNGHVVHKIEGFARHSRFFPGIRVLLEIKSKNQRIFNLIASDKPLRQVAPKDWAQCIVYMHRLELKYCAYFAYHRDTGKIVMRVINADPEEATRLEALAWSIMTSKVPLSKLSNQATNHVCKQCDMIEPCQFRAAPPRTCRSCVNSTPSQDVEGRMHCEIWGDPIPDDFILTTCDRYTRII